MDKMDLVLNAKNIYATKYFEGLTTGAIVPSSILIKYKCPDMYAAKVVFTIKFDSDGGIAVMDWFKDNWTNDIANKLAKYFELLGYKAYII